MIHFRSITEENFDAILRMRRPEGEGFVASNAYSLAQAWLYRENEDVFPCAIYHEDTPVGFLLLEEDAQERKLMLWRIMFPPEQENKGYGTAAVRLLISLARESGRYNELYLDCSEKNAAAMHIYRKLGFQPTGDINHGDLEMRLTL